MTFASSLARMLRRVLTLGALATPALAWPLLARAQGADAWKQVSQTAFESRVCRQLVLGLTAHERLDGGVTGPEVRAAQGADTRDFH